MSWCETRVKIDVLFGSSPRVHSNIASRRGQRLTSPEARVAARWSRERDVDDVIREQRAREAFFRRRGSGYFTL